MTEKTLDWPEELMPSAEELEKADEEVSIAVLSTGIQTNGKPYWAYIAVPPSKYRAFKEAELNGNFRLNDFGVVLRSGEAEQPPSSVQQEMEREYNFMHDLEEKILEAAKEFDGDEEKARIFTKFGIRKK